MTQTGAFLVTVAIEIPTVVALSSFPRSRRPNLGRLLVVALAANALTHPLLWLADGALAAHLDRTPRWALLESAVVLAEGAAYAAAAATGRLRGLALAFAANAASLGAGLLVAIRDGAL